MVHFTQSRSMRNSLGSCHAFHLVELLVAVAILFVFVAILLPTIRTAKYRAEVINCSSNLRQLHTATMLFHADHHFFPIGYSDDTKPAPGQRWSRIRRPGGLLGTYTQWQIELAPYLGNGMVEPANWILHPTH